jgi:hypothetical protein
LSKSTAPGTEVKVVPGLLVTEMAFAGLLTASTHPAATSAALSFDFMAVIPLNEPPQPPTKRTLQGSPVNYVFLDNVPSY